RGAEVGGILQQLGDGGDLRGEHRARAVEIRVEGVQQPHPLDQAGRELRPRLGVEDHRDGVDHGRGRGDVAGEHRRRGRRRPTSAPRAESVELVDQGLRGWGGHPDIVDTPGRPGAQDPPAAGIPSEGWTTTKPGPWKPSWTDSPEPRPISEPILKSFLSCGWRFADQHTAACGSTQLGCCEQSSSIGGPSEVTATMPWPWRNRLNRPPAMKPAPPRERMSHWIELSKASMFRVFRVRASPSSWIRKISSAWRA